jgi:Kef-type K+ transport system membrane component KefB
VGLMMHFQHDVIFFIFLIFMGATILGTIVLSFRQSLLIAYMFSGILLGPYGLKYISNVEMVRSIGDVGILFLLFLLGLHLPPQKLGHMLKKISVVGVVSSIVFFILGYALGWGFGFPLQDNLIIGLGLMFSSTIIGIKLLPTTVLHHQHTGELMISVLLWQDLLAILILLIINVLGGDGSFIAELSFVALGFPLVLLIVYLLYKFVLLPLLTRFSRIKEYVFLVAIAWCLCIAELASFFGLSHEVGAFIAGVSLAASPIALYIAESLKPVRDFFLVMFFFSVGAGFDLHYLPVIILPACVMAVGVFLLKPVVYRWLLVRIGEDKNSSWEVGFRLGQVSEFALIIAFLALTSGLVSMQASYLLQAGFILSSILSSYFVVMKYPTPVAMSERLRRD